MDMPVDAWCQAALDRHSRRTLDEKAIAPPVFEELEAVCSADGWGSLEWGHATRVAIVRELRTNIFKGIVGAYGRIEGAPSCLLFVGDRAVPHMSELLGYAGEAVLLEATRLGLATCWVGGFFKRERAVELVSLGPSEEIVAVSPLGYPADRQTFSEKLMKTLAGAHKRRELEVLAPGVTGDGWPEWAQEAVSLARVAPSAVNRQPWRFRFEDGALIVALDDVKDTYHIPKRLDCGISMLHAEVGARAHGAPGTWEFLDGVDVARYTV